MQHTRSPLVLMPSIRAGVSSELSFLSILEPRLLSLHMRYAMPVPEQDDQSAEGGRGEGRAGGSARCRPCCLALHPTSGGRGEAATIGTFSIQTLPSVSGCWRLAALYLPEAPCKQSAIGCDVMQCLHGACMSFACTTYANQITHAWYTHGQGYPTMSAVAVPAGARPGWPAGSSAAAAATSRSDPADSHTGCTPGRHQLVPGGCASPLGSIVAGAEPAAWQ